MQILKRRKRKREREKIVGSGESKGEVAEIFKNK
jgi:hypothetical protein